jgi:hypothetical protein
MRSLGTPILLREWRMLSNGVVLESRITVNRQSVLLVMIERKIIVPFG